MGGNAIKKNGKSICGRLHKNIYELVKQHALAILRSNNIICEIVLELPGKESFGDIDILYVPSCEISDMRKFISEKFKITDPTHIMRNGYVMSSAFNCKDLGIKDIYFQLDFLNMQSVEHMEMARFYFSYGDIGSIIGRISNFYGMKFGDQGLWCELYESSAYPNLSFDVRKTIGKVMLSNDPREICSFMGFDYDFWLNEIPKLTTKEDHLAIFNWITKSKFFNKEMFYNLNSDHRDRQETRPFYQSFLEYICITEINKADVINGETGGIKNNFQPQAIDYFGKAEEMNKLITDVELKKKRQAKFSGKYLIDSFQNKGVKLEGKKVGDELQKFKKYCLDLTCEKNWDSFLDNFEKEKILEFVEDYTQ